MVSRILKLLFPLFILLALVSYFTGANLTLSGFLSNIEGVQFYELDISLLKSSINALDFTQYFQGSNNVLDVLKGLLDSITAFFNSTFGLLRFSLLLIKFFIYNLYILIINVFGFITA